MFKSKMFILAVFALVVITATAVSAESIVTKSDIELNYRISHDGNVAVVDIGGNPGAGENRIRITSGVSTGTVTTRFDLNESLYCTSSNTIMGQYNEMMSVCQKSIMNNGNITKFLLDLKDAEVKKTEFESLWTVERNRREELEANFAKVQSDLESVTSERDNYKRTADTVSARTDALRSCEKDLEDSEDNKSTNLILGGLVGVAGGYFMWGRKRNSQFSDLPPEHEEAEYDY